MGLKFQNFLKIFYFSPKFSKKGTLRGTDFCILVFFRHYLGLVEVKTGTLTRGASPVPFFWLEWLLSLGDNIILGCLVLVIISLNKLKIEPLTG